ncbi:hypothetical protein AMTRI_Chr13g124610 [Amborella trichopoda]
MHQELNLLYSHDLLAVLMALFIQLDVKNKKEKENSFLQGDLQEEVISILLQWKTAYKSRIISKSFATVDLINHFYTGTLHLVTIG